MGRYANQKIRLDFPDLSEDGDPIFVIIRNPKTMPMDRLRPEEDIPTDPVTGERDENLVLAATYKIMAGLVTAWNVYDATADDDSPALPVPATAEHFACLPVEIVSSIGNEMKAALANPQ